MIALRPIHGKFGPMKVTIHEGKKIPEQILILLDVKELLRTKQIKEEKEDKPQMKKEYRTSEDTGK